jgi:CRP/FNR family transcriptional regulator, cyclic AMP receptor protein
MAAADGLGRAESALLADGTRAIVPYAPATVEGPAALISRALRERHERARDRIFNLLGAVQPDLAFEDVRLNLREADPVRRANAVELLHAQRWRAPLVALKPLVMALIDDSTRDAKLAAVARRLALPHRTVDGWTAALLDDDRPWMRACAAYFAAAAGVVAARERLAALSGDPDPLVRDAARAACHRLDHPEEAPNMLTTADKVLFLKGLELFTAIRSEDLAEIATVTEEVSLEDGETVFTSGDRGDALYMVVEGRVRIHVGDSKLAELGEREVFGEMALLDPAPRSASATASGGAVVLRIGQDDFANVLADRPEVAAGILRVLTRRLRTANRDRVRE